MNLIIAIIMSILAINKLTIALMDYDGPFNVIKYFREGVERLQSENIKALHFECFFCLSTVVTTPFAIYVANGPVEFLIYWFGLSGGALLVNRISEAIY